MDSSRARWLLVHGQIRRRQWHGAVETLKAILAEDPDDADAHGQLAICLLRLKRPQAAQAETRIAMALAPEGQGPRYAAAEVAIARRRLKEAAELLQSLRDLDPEDSECVRLLAHVRSLQGKRQEAHSLLEQALALAPEDPDILVDLGDLALGRGELDEAEARAREALSLAPEHGEALLTMGYVHLRRGRSEEARDHAIWALSNNPSSREALRLLASIKARKNPLLGLWWRYSVWMGDLGQGRAILVLLGAFVLYRVGVIWAENGDDDQLASLIQIFWLGLVAYTWFGPTLFRQSLEKELKAVELDRKF